MRVQIHVLGTVGMVVDDRPEAVTSRSQRTVLGVLAARAGTAVTTDVLVDALWPDAPPRTAVSSLRTYVSRLRRVLGDAIASTPGGYRLDIDDDDDLDLLRFEDLLDRATGAPPSVALDLLEDALDLWRGPPFGDVGDVHCIRPVCARLDERRLAAQEERAAVLLAVGRPQDAVAAAEELLAHHPLRERLWTVLVEALAAAARPTEALRAYQRAIDALADAGLEPTAELRRAEASVLVEDAPAPPRRAVAVPASSFIGRDDDRAALSRLLRERHIVTLVGPGGVGKTRLARTVAADDEHRFTGGARMVELAGIDDPEHVPGAICSDLGLTVDARGPMAALTDVGDLHVLVVVDNCEHVIDAAATAIGCLVSGNSRLRVIATSREPLALDGEQLWPVAPLRAETDAVQLFIDRARSVRPGFRPSAADRDTIVEVVTHLDGLPLAVEMAAASLRILPLPELARRLTSEVDPPGLERRDVDERHRSLKALVDWSVRLLDDEARDVFSSLPVFAGWVTAEDVATVCGQPSPFDALCRLVDRSLLVVDTSADTAAFRMLRTVRRSAGAPAALEDGALRARHAAWLLDAVSEADQQLRTPDEVVGHRRIERLIDDARAAMAWSRQHDPDRAVLLAGRLYLFAQSRLRDEMLGWAEDVVRDRGDELHGPGTDLALTAAAQRAVIRGDLARARALVERAVALGGPAPDPLALEVLSDVQLFSGELEAARQTSERGLRVASAADDPYGIAVSVANLVLANAHLGDHATAAEVLEQARSIPELAPSAAAWLSYIDGERLLDRQPRHALAALDEAMALADSVGNRYVAAVARVSSASLLSRTGDPADARAPFEELIAHWRSHGDRTHLLTTLRNLVTLLDRLGMPEQAAELLGAVLGDAVAPTYGSERDLLEHAATRLREQLGPAETERRSAMGRDRPIDVTAALAQRWLGGDGPPSRRE